MPLQGTHTLTDVPADQLAIIIAGFRRQAAEVTTKKQDNDLWTVIAKFSD